MKQYLLFALLIGSVSCLTSCVGAKKYKALQAENIKLENTFLETKTNLAAAKRNLNKLEDQTTQSVEQKSSKITELEKQVALCETVLQKTQKERLAVEQESKNMAAKMKQENQIYQKEFKPLVAVKESLQEQYNTLKLTRQKLLDAYALNPDLKLNLELGNNGLMITFDDKFLFSSSGRSLSDKGREAIYTLAEVLLQDSSLQVQIKGHTDADSDKNNNWKNSSRQPLSVLYTLTNKGIADDRMYVSYYGQYRPIGNATTDAVATDMNNRVEIVLYYNTTDLLQTIPIK